MRYIVLKSMSCGEFLSVCVLVADLADVDEMEWGMYIRGDCSPRGVMLQLRPQRQCHLKSSTTLSVVFLKRVIAFILVFLLTQQFSKKLV